MKAVDNDEELLDMALELMALSEKAEHPFVKKLLHNFAVGLNEMEEDCEQRPFWSRYRWKIPISALLEERMMSAHWIARS